MSDNDEKLDRLLSAPLEPVADNGFSARAMTMVAIADAYKPWLETAVLVASACVLLVALPVAGLSESIESASATLAASALPLAIAGFALALTWSYVRVLAD